MGCDLELLHSELAIEKRKYIVNLSYAVKENALSDFVVLSKAMLETPAGEERLNYHSILMGFLGGCARTMGFNPTLRLERDSLYEGSNEKETMSSAIGGRGETAFAMEMWKEKEDD